MHRSHRPDPPRRPRLAATDLEQHRPALTGVCRRMLGSAAEAEDAVQETLLRAWRAGHRFEGRAPLGAWLFRIARNVCLDELGRAARSPRLVPLADAAGSPPDGAAEATRPALGDAGAADPAAVVLHRETVRLACAVALQVLPPRQRAVLVLCVVLRVPAREAAQLLGTSVASVNSSLQRARATLLAADARPHAVDPLPDPDRRLLLRRYVTAFATGDARALAALALEEHGPGRATAAPLALAA